MVHAFLTTLVYSTNSEKKREHKTAKRKDSTGLPQSFRNEESGVCNINTYLQDGQVAGDTPILTSVQSLNEKTKLI